MTSRGHVDGTQAAAKRRHGTRLDPSTPCRTGVPPASESLASAGRRAHSWGRNRVRSRAPDGLWRGESMDKELTEDERAALVALIERLREEHRDLDAAIEALSDAGQAADRLQLQRLKKRKLLLRDRLVLLEAELTPDIIA